MKKQGQFIFRGITTVILLALIVAMLLLVNTIQGVARVVTYTGIVGGAAQRLVKNEFYGIKDDSEIARIDEIFKGLKTGESSYNLKALNDNKYQEKLQALTDEWSRLKSRIYEFRENPSKKDAPYRVSEVYYIMADETVSAAESYSKRLVQNLTIVEILLIINISAVISFLIFQVVGAIKTSRRLSSIAYIDSNTGLPNKRSCEDKLNEGGIVEAKQNVCCLMFDLNNLKLVNDTMGHKYGDALIGTFASLLRRTAPPKMFIGRLGGDEFIGVSEGIDRDEIMSFINTLREKSDYLNNENNENRICISFATGYAFSADYPNCTIKTLMDIADKNMYLNKIEIKSRLNTNCKGC